MKISFGERKLYREEFFSLTEHEQRVISCFERVTGFDFLRSDLIYLKLMLKKATPEQICSKILEANKEKNKKMVQGMESGFTNFKYLYKWIIQINLRNQIKSKKEKGGPYEK